MADFLSALGNLATNPIVVAPIISSAVTALALLLQSYFLSRRELVRIKKEAEIATKRAKAARIEDISGRTLVTLMHLYTVVEDCIPLGQHNSMYYREPAVKEMVQALRHKVSGHRGEVYSLGDEDLKRHFDECRFSIDGLLHIVWIEDPSGSAEHVARWNESHPAFAQRAQELADLQMRS